MEDIMSVVNGEIFGVWFLIGAALVFWMQAGFAMVETGFQFGGQSGVLCDDGYDRIGGDG